MNPIRELERDMVILAQLAIDAGSFFPEPGMGVYQERKIRRILKRYAIKKKRQPVYRATTK